MRPLHLSDLHHAACALRQMPQERRDGRIKAAVLGARLADRYRIATGRSHPDWGNGTLIGAFGTVIVPDYCDADYLQAMAVVVRALTDR